MGTKKESTFHENWDEYFVPIKASHEEKTVVKLDVNQKFVKTEGQKIRKSEKNKI